jgi:hypothetical protein
MSLTTPHPRRQSLLSVIHSSIPMASSPLRTFHERLLIACQSRVSCSNHARMPQAPKSLFLAKSASLEISFQEKGVPYCDCTRRSLWSRNDDTKITIFSVNAVVDIRNNRGPVSMLHNRSQHAPTTRHVAHERPAIVACDQSFRLATILHTSHPTLLLAIQISIEVPPEVLTRIVKPQLLVNAVDLLHILRLQFKVALEIILDPALRLALRQHTSSIVMRSAIILRRTSTYTHPCAIPQASATWAPLLPYCLPISTSVGSSISLLMFSPLL